MSMAPGLDGVIDIAVIADPLAHGGTPGRKVPPSLLLRLGALGSWPIGVVAKGVTAASLYLWGVSIGAVPVGSSHHLGCPREHDAAPGCRALGLLLEGNVEEPLRLIQPLVGLYVWHVGDVF